MSERGCDLATVDHQISKLRLAVRKGLLEALTKLDWEAPETLPWTIQQFVLSDFKAAVLADKLSTTQSSISRWAQGQRLPPSPITREGMMARLYKLLEKEIEAGAHNEPQPLRDNRDLPAKAPNEIITPLDDG